MANREIKERLKKIKTWDEPRLNLELTRLKVEDLLMGCRAGK